MLMIKEYFDINMHICFVVIMFITLFIVEYSTINNKEVLFVENDILWLVFSTPIINSVFSFITQLNNYFKEQANNFGLFLYGVI